MKRLLLFLLSLQFFAASLGQDEQKYLVFTFNRKYQIKGERWYDGSCDNVWIVPFDSCKNGLSEENMKPLFITESMLMFLTDSINGVGRYFVSDYDEKDTTAWTLYKNRRIIQERTIEYTYLNSKDVLTIYFVPIVAKCQTHLFGYFRKPVITIDGTPKIWKGFWKEKDMVLRSLLCHDFSDFNYVVTAKKDCPRVK